MAKNQTQTSADIEASGSPADMRRRRFVVHGAALGAAAGGLSLGIGPATGFAATGEPTRAGAAGLQPLEVDSPMARWKKPQSLEFVTGATERFTFPNWQSGNEDSVYYNLNIPSFFKSRVVRQAPEFSVLQRAINPDLLNLTFTAHDGTTTPTLKEYLVGPRQVQAMMMAHKGKVVFETYPGGHGQYRRLQGVHGTGIRNQMVRRNAADEYRAVGPCLRRWRHVQARQHGPGDLRRSGPRLLWHVLRLGDQRREGRRHRSLPVLSPGDGETLGWRLILAFPSAEEVGAG
jgi:hypothetical protein